VRSEISIPVDNSDPRDPAAQCDRCGRVGTIARAVRHTEPPLLLRYCGDCWPVAQKELEIRQRDEPEPGWSSASRSWYDVRKFLALIAQLTQGGPAATSAQLAEIAAEIRAAAIEMDGPMPPDVEEFIARHLPPSA
jgi:hypothetical protein